MGTLVKHWQIVVLALVLSLGSALALIFMRKDSWLPTASGEVRKATPISEGGVTASKSFKDWEFSAAELDNLRSQLAGEKAQIEKERAEQEALREQIQSESAELVRLRAELESLREDIQQDLIIIDESEQKNLRSLSNVYAEMKAPAAVKVFSELETETVVKILSLMPSDASARILGTLAELPGDAAVRQAAEITDAFRKLKR